jgi:RimJ/RimL family protein N-acetyltransferase
MAPMTNPVLTTDRLDLYRPHADDLAGLKALMEPDAMRLHLGRDAPTLVDTFARLTRNAGSWAMYGYGTFMVRERGSSVIIGNCGVFHSWRGIAAFDNVAEAGWIIAADHWGRGYAAEAMTAALDWFDRVHAIRPVMAMIAPANAPSLALAARLGFAAFGEDDFDGHAVTLLQRD